MALVPVLSLLGSTTATLFRYEYSLELVGMDLLLRPYQKRTRRVPELDSNLWLGATLVVQASSRDGAPTQVVLVLRSVPDSLDVQSVA